MLKSLSVLVAVFVATSLMAENGSPIDKTEQVRVLRAVIERTLGDNVVLVATCNQAVEPKELPRGLRNGVLRQHMKGLEKLHELNREERRLPTFSGLSLTYIERSQLKAIIAKGGWELFRELHPTWPEVITLSYPYLDAAEKRAMVYVTRSSGLTSASSAILILKKRKDGWRLADTIELLIS